MAFRDDEVAGRARADVLEREVERLRAENDALRTASPSRQTTHSSRLRYVPAALFVLALALGLLAVRGGGAVEVPATMGALLLFFAALATAIVTRLVHFVPPGAFLVISGRSQVGPDGKLRGYRVVFEGRTVCVPLLERVDSLPTGPFVVDVSMRDVRAKDGPVHVNARGVIAVPRDPDLATRAVERFLGKAEAELVDVARATLEGAVRSFAPELTADQLRTDRLGVATKLMREAEDDFASLGLSLLSFHVAELRPM